MKRLWAMPLRTWLALALVAMILTPLLSWIGVIVAVEGPMKTKPSPWERQSDEALVAVVQLIRAHPDRWAEPAFQKEIVPLLTRGGYSAGLLDADGRLLFRHGSVGAMPVLQNGEWREFEIGAPGDRHYSGIVHLPDGSVAGLFLLARSGMDPLAFWVIGAVVGGVTLALVLLVWWMGHSFNRPLTALTEAAHRINQGDLNFSLPPSRVRELNEVGAAFGAMRDGLRQSIQRQAELEQERRFFIAAVAHDLRTPLSSVRGYLEGLRDGVARSPEQVQRYVSVALEKAGALERLTESLFAYAKTEYLEQPPRPQELELGHLLRTTVAGLQPAAATKGVRLDLDPPDQPCWLLADPQMLTRVVDNLLDNGIRHTPAGGTVTVGWRQSQNECQFWVQDTGLGIDSAQLEHIFEPHFRGDQARSSRFGGAGLGLTIARRLVEAHGGRIAATNAGGARLSVVLPLGA